MSNFVETRRKKEKEVLEEMIAIYCHGNHGTKKKDGLCPECAKLNEYAQMRTDKCPFMETKTFCSNCKVHCYKPEMRAKIKEVMRYAGPRMMFYHPLLAILHPLAMLKEKHDLKKREQKKAKETNTKEMKK